MRLWTTWWKMLTSGRAGRETSWLSGEVPWNFSLAILRSVGDHHVLGFVQIFVWLYHWIARFLLHKSQRFGTTPHSCCFQVQFLAQVPHSTGYKRTRGITPSKRPDLIRICEFFDLAEIKAENFWPNWNRDGVNYFDIHQRG